MAADDKQSAAHIETAIQHEAILTGVIALANLFSSCVEAFGLIHPSQKWIKDEQLLMTRLGLQQARLLIWGDVMGISSPPSSVTDRAVPKHPSSAYPDLTEPTFFAPRDPRLDEPNTRTTVEQALSAIVDRSSTHTREEMMAKFGLKAPKRSSINYQPALDLTRLEAYRERWELLREVAESYAQINTRRNNSIMHSPWMIADTAKFASFINLTQEKVDFLIDLMGVKERVDRAMSMDIRALGWHLTVDRTRIALDVSKLRMLYEICTPDYPEYLPAIKKALDNIGRESREAAGLNPYPAPSATDAAAKVRAEQSRRPSLFGIFKFGKSKEHQRSASLSVGGDEEPQRSKSDSGLPSTSEPAPLGQVRSKSIGAYTEPQMDSIDEELLRIRMEKFGKPAETLAAPLEEPVQKIGSDPVQETDQVEEAEELPPLRVANADPIRHDQYHGIARTMTKDLHQGDY